MSTRSNIARLLDGGKVEAIYCHFDGYPEGVGLTLIEHYTTADKVNKLIELGNISSLGEFLEPQEDTSIYSTQAYRRDRGETGIHTESTLYESVEDYIATISHPATGIEYVYIFTNHNEWEGWDCARMKRVDWEVVKVYG